MPPRLNSRYMFCLGFKDLEAGSNALQLTERSPFGYQAYDDNVEHLVGEGDSLTSLASRYFSPLERAAGLWWVIADFQPTPIHDPTLRLKPGTTIIVPSLRTVQEVIFSEARRQE